MSGWESYSECPNNMKSGKRVDSFEGMNLIGLWIDRGRHVFQYLEAIGVNESTNGLVIHGFQINSERFLDVFELH